MTFSFTGPAPTWVEDVTIQIAARLIVAGLDDLPIEETGESHGLHERGIATLRALIGEMEWPDVCLALRSAAERLPEPSDEHEPVTEELTGLTYDASATQLLPILPPGDASVTQLLPVLSQQHVHGDDQRDA